MDDQKTGAASVPAGQALYQGLLAEYQQAQRYAQSAMTDAALRFAASNKEEDRIPFLIARARHEAAEAATYILTRRGGEFVRLMERAA